MTRTERATSPRAILKDRSESKNAMDKHTPKHGAGHGNWGSLIHERELEEDAVYDEQKEANTQGASSKPATTAAPRKTSTSGISEEDRVKAREFRKTALKNGDIDLAAIARTSAGVSTSPDNTTVPVVSDADTKSTSAA